MSSWQILTVEVTTVSASSLLTVANSMGLNICNVRYVDDLCVQLSISGTEYSKFHKLVCKRGDTINIISRSGIYFFGIRCLQRPVLLISIVLWLFLVLFLPTRVLFVQVEGNKTLDATMIIDAAEKCGIHFGASRRYVRSEKVKNSLLSEIEGLQWAGVNTKGCLAVISIKERYIPTKNEPENGACSIVAARDGIISEMTVTKGTPICKVGQAVRKGQVLVSGYTDLGLLIKAEKANAEIIAITNRKISAVTLSAGYRRVDLRGVKVNYSIQIGKNVVKLYNKSGIPDTNCAKMYTQRVLTLPGGFELPVSLIKETLYCYDSVKSTVTAEKEFDWMRSSVEAYLQQEMVAGSIQRESARCELLDEIYYMTGIYICEEIIGKTRAEEFGYYDGKRNR